MSNEQRQGENEAEQGRAGEAPAGSGSRIEELAEDVGRLLGTAKVKAGELMTQLTGAAGGEDGADANRVVGVIQPAPLSKRQRRKLSPEVKARSAEALQARWARLQAEAHGSGRRKG